MRRVEDTRRKDRLRKAGFRAYRGLFGNRQCNAPAVPDTSEGQAQKGASDDREAGDLAPRKQGASQLSGGEKQCTVIARAIDNDPSVILANEPTGALDSKTAADIMAVFEELNAEGKTVVIVTHDKDIAGQYARRIEISDGTIMTDQLDPNKHFTPAFGGGNVTENGDQNLSSPFVTTSAEPLMNSINSDLQIGREKK